MPVTIENLIDKPVILRLNSGQTLHLSPGYPSEPIDETEVQNNEKANKLQSQRVILLRQATHQDKPKIENKKK